MARTAACPSCGAPVVFKSAASIFAVCEYCQSTLVRHDQALEDIGKMAALAEDRSPLQLGSEGHWQGLHFALIGRIQLRYGEGLWNEWHLLFDDQRTGWLSEANGEYVVSFLHQVREPLPPFESLAPGGRLTLASRAWTVTNIEDAECVAGQGELPFKVGPGYKAPVVDLRCGDNFATLDYSETPPLLFVGSAVAFKSLKLSHLREGMPAEAPTVAAQVFRCPSCGSAMQARSKEILAVGCGSCGAVVDTSRNDYKLLSKALGMRDEKHLPRIPLGSTGTLDGQPVEVIGFMVRESVCEGVAYAWGEYLLAAGNGTYRWLTEYDGHWNVVDVLSQHPSGGNDFQDVNYEGGRYKHFATSKAEVIQVQGEFNWRVKRGDVSAVADFVAPPLMLSRDRTAKEVSWSRCLYVEPETIAGAFGLKETPGSPLGVYANQPNPWEETHGRVCRMFWWALLVVVLLQAYFAVLGGSPVLLRQQLAFQPHGNEDTVVSQAFVVKPSTKKLVVSHDTDLYNDWIGLNVNLVNKATGEAWQAPREISYYAGVDDGESWSEGSRNNEVVFVGIPAGTYYLAIDPDYSDTPRDVHSRLEVTAGSPGWSNFVLVLLFLAVFPIFTRLRRGAFEVRRWAESDHAPVASDDSDDD
jgi:ribosomal protein L37AE/L43A